MDRRTDRLTQLYIDAIINGLAGTGHQAAAQALCELDIPLATALRVLTRPGERRRASRHQPVLAHEALARAAGSQVSFDVED